MSKKIIVTKIVNSGNESNLKRRIVAIIKKESIIDIYKKEINLEALKSLIEVEKLISNNDPSYKLELVDEEDVALINFNAKLNEQKNINEFMFFKSFILSLVEELYEKCPYENIKTSLYSIYNCDDLEEKKAVIKNLNMRIKQINNKR